jgi:hypothetical protein
MEKLSANVNLPYKMRQGYLLAEQTMAGIEAQIAGWKLPELKAAAQATKLSTRGLSTRQDFAGVIRRWHVNQCMKIVGYVPDSSPNAMQLRMRASIEAQNAK